MPDGGGYWIAAGNGGVAPFGDAAFFGSMAGTPLNSPINHIVATPTGGATGWWPPTAASSAFGDAHFYGSTASSTSTPHGRHGCHPDGGATGWSPPTAASSAFGDAHFYGSTGGPPQRPGRGHHRRHRDGGGYWLVASDGGVFAFGRPILRLDRAPSHSTSHRRDGRHSRRPGLLVGGLRRRCLRLRRRRTSTARRVAATLNRPVVGIAADAATGRLLAGRLRRRRLLALPPRSMGRRNRCTRPLRGDLGRRIRIATGSIPSRR